MGAQAIQGKKTLRPIRDRILVKVSEAVEKTPGGIVLPDAAKEKPRMGVIVATGPGKHRPDVGPEVDRLPMEVRSGDVVLFGAYAGTEVRIGGVAHLVLDEADVLGVIEDEALDD